MSDSLNDRRAEAIVTALYLERSAHFSVARSNGITRAHFTDEALGVAWDVAERFYASDVLPASPRLAITEELRQAGETEAIEAISQAAGDAMEYLAQVDDLKAGRPMMARLIELKRLRDVLYRASQIVVDLNSVNSPSMAPRVWPRITSLHSQMTTTFLAHENGDIDKLNQFEALADILSRGDVDVISSGVPLLDAEICGGWNRGRVNIIAAYTSHGKTNLILFFLDNIIKATPKGGAVLLFTPELTERKVAARRLSRMALIPNDQIKNTERTIASLEYLKPHFVRMIVDDTAAPTGEYMMNRARAVHEEFGLEAIGLDYLERAGGDGEMRVRITEAMLWGERIAKRFNIPALFAAQLNREGLTAKKPSLIHLAESSSIEKYSSVVTIHRWPAKAYEQLQKDYQGNPNAFVSFIAKNTDGTTGTFDWYTLPEYHTYSILDPTRNSLAPF